MVNIQFLTHDNSVLKKFHFRIWISCVAAFIQLVQLLILQNNVEIKRHKSHELIFGWFNWAAIAGSSSMIFVSRDVGPILKMYLNSLFKFKKRYKPRATFSNKIKLSSNSLLEWLHLLLVPMFVLNAVVFPPLLVIGVHFANPCKPSLIGYFVLDECRKIEYNQTNIVYIALNVIVKTAIFLSNIGVLWFTFHGAAFLVITVTMIGAMTSKECLQIFLSRVKSGKEIYEAALLYREIYIINILCNFVQQKFIGIVMSLVISTLSISLNLMVMHINRSSKVDSKSFIVAFFGLIVVECVFVILVIFEGMVGVNKESKYKLRICKRMVGIYEPVKCKRWLRKYWRSCNVLKVKFGDVNFFEELTLLKCLDLSFNLTVQILLLSGNK